MANYKVVEIFSSINGEGMKAGQIAVFIRMQGCNLDCKYCDTAWANEENCRFHWTSTEEIVELIRSMWIKNVTITGGEPLLQENIRELLEVLSKEPGIEVEIETNGSVDLMPFMDIENRPSFTMDYKLPSSGAEDEMVMSNLNCIDKRDMVKFVIGDVEDLVRAKEVIEEYDLTTRTNVHFSPVWGEIEMEQIVWFMKSHHLNNVTLQLQLHKIIWDPQMRGV
ncbi:MAG: putative 7-carboxy-7-deazaguanine synthase QueE [Eubacterium sp.]|nr:putative 7-carboxy-7-deazaguanine synthase QueE [Eubacterium sp.]